MKWHAFSALRVSHLQSASERRAMDHVEVLIVAAIRVWLAKTYTVHMLQRLTSARQSLCDGMQVRAVPAHDDNNDMGCFGIVEIEDSSRLRIKSPAVNQYDYGADLEKIPVD